MGSNPAWDATALKNAFYQLLEPKKTRCLDDFASNRPLHQPYPALSLNHGDFAVMTLQDGLVAYKTFARAEGLSPKTIRWIMSSVGYFAEFLGSYTQELSLISGHDLRRFIVALRDKHKFSDHPFTKPSQSNLSPQTIETYCRAIRSFFGFLTREGFIASNPIAGVKMPKVPNLVVPTLSPKEALLLLSQPDKKTVVGFRDYAIMLTLIDSGIRLSELSNLKTQDVDFDQNLFKVLGKGNKERYVPFGARVAKTLMKYKLHFKSDTNIGTDSFWLCRDGHPLPGWRIEKIIRNYGKQAGLKRCYPHMLRHTSSVMFLRNGGDVFSLQKKCWLDVWPGNSSWIG